MQKLFHKFDADFMELGGGENLMPIFRSEAGLLNKSSCFALASSVTRVITMFAMILVTLCCAA
jgi:hypothetical protein